MATLQTGLRRGAIYGDLATDDYDSFKRIPVSASNR